VRKNLVELGSDDSQMIDDDDGNARVGRQMLEADAILKKIALKRSLSRASAVRTWIAP